MAYIKTYKTRNNEARIIFTLGEVTVDAHFKDGNMRDNVFATMTTRDALVQKVVESSPLYGKVVFLDRVVEIAEPKAEEPEKSAIDSLDKITNKDELRQYLANNFNIEAKTIIAPNALKAKVREFGLVLPNMVW